MVQKARASHGQKLDTNATAEPAPAPPAARATQATTLHHNPQTETSRERPAKPNTLQEKTPLDDVNPAPKTTGSLAAQKAGAAKYTPKAPSEELPDTKATAIDKNGDKPTSHSKTQQAQQQTPTAKQRTERWPNEPNQTSTNTPAITGESKHPKTNAMTNSKRKHQPGEAQRRTTTNTTGNTRP
ncbi:hypothetical protein [Kaistia granuli]|uniref:hypothetical protein n=1 Tax=Kaistia granuli TaxID=363259 RepID=UPI001AEC3D33|nr:hypothetical protein [Kaistia granuli]